MQSNKLSIRDRESKRLYMGHTYVLGSSLGRQLLSIQQVFIEHCSEHLLMEQSLLSPRGILMRSGSTLETEEFGFPEKRV